MNVDINTKFVGLLGTPLAQSFSAGMQNAAYEAAGLNMVYFYNEVGREHLEDVVNGIRHMPFAGFAVTKPNKVEVLKFLDGLDPLCEKIGASNTVVKTPDGKLIGYNTDCTGFYTSLTEETGIDPREHTFFCFGAGGAARAMCGILAHNGAKKIYITARTAQSALKLTDDINSRFSLCAEAVMPGDYRRVLGECTVVMNASGIGMGATVGMSPMDKNDIIPGTLYFDACYNPEKTRFLLDAEEKGCRVLNGLGMVLYQGVAQIELWTGQKAPVDVMRRELLNIISGK